MTASGHRYDQFRANKDASITEIHDFVKLIPGLKESYASLNQHINITEELKKTTDSAAFRSLWRTERELLEGDAIGEVSKTPRFNAEHGLFDDCACAVRVWVCPAPARLPSLEPRCLRT